MMRVKKSANKWAISLALSLSLFGLCLAPMQTYAIGDAAVVAVLTEMWNWAKGAMFNKFQNFQKGETNRLMGKAEDIFKRKAQWEKWPASAKELFVEQSVKYENQAKQDAYKNASDYLKYAQGSASGVEASKYPAKVVYSFNTNYENVQKLNTNCNITVPEPVGSTQGDCTPAQKQFTNYLITGVRPIPDYSPDTTNTSDGQAYIQAKRVSETRTALVQVALNQANGKSTVDYIEYLEKNLKTPSVSQINTESSAAVARDALILAKLRALMSLKQYEATLMNERLLATLVAQGEDAHLTRIRQLAHNFS